MECKRVEMHTVCTKMDSLYHVLIDNLTVEEIDRLRDETTIRTDINPMSLQQAKTVSLMEMDSEWIHLPRFFGWQTFGDADVVLTTTETPRTDTMQFNGY